jgi:uncharacterized membrane protein (UPF0127 family)
MDSSRIHLPVSLDDRRLRLDDRPGRAWRAVAAGIILLWALAIAGCANAPATPANSPPTVQVTLGGEQFTLELANDPQTRERGLMHRTEIPQHGGMIFVFPAPQQQNFWMGHCLTDMDIAYLDGLGRVVARHTMRVEPPKRPEESEESYKSRMARYPSRIPAQFAIEVKAGELERLGVKIGDKIELDLERLKAAAR